ncbi:MAG: hypothetical protein ACOCUV_03795, partial [bacterium]
SKKSEINYNIRYLYMKIYDTLKDKGPQVVQYIPLQYLLMMTQNKFPKELIDEICSRPEVVNKETLRVIKEDFETFKQGTIGGSVFMDLARRQIDLGIERQYRGQKHRVNRNMRKSLYFGAGDILKRLKSLTRTARRMSGVYPHDPESREHKDNIKKIDEIIMELKKLRSELEGGDGLIKQVSTPEGEKWLSNL